MQLLKLTLFFKIVINRVFIEQHVYHQKDDRDVANKAHTGQGFRETWIWHQRQDCCQCSWQLILVCDIANVVMGKQFLSQRRSYPIHLQLHKQYELPCTLTCLNFQHKYCSSMGKYKSSATFVMISIIIGPILVGHKTHVHGNHDLY